VDPSKVVVLLNIPPPTTAKQLWSMLGYTGYCRKFIRSYASIKTMLEKLLKKYEAFTWIPKRDQAFHTLKEKISIDPILIYPNWQVEFHVHIDSCGTTFGAILMKPGSSHLLF